MQKEKIPVKKIILSTIAVAGLLSVAVLAPNALQVIRQFSGKSRYDKKYYINSSVKGLIEKGFVKFESKNGQKFVRLTKKGEEQLAKYELGNLEIKKPKKWDKKWRVVMFDIKEKRRGTRTLIRQTLNRLGFVKLQNSVWVFPYACEELVIMMKSNLFIGKDVLYMTVDKLENDKWLKEVFELR